MIAVAVIAVVLAYARPAARRWRYCWEQEDGYAKLEQQFWAETIWTRDGYPGTKQRIAEECGHRKWRYRFAAFRFWEPPEWIEAEPDFGSVTLP